MEFKALLKWGEMIERLPVKLEEGKYLILVPHKETVFSLAGCLFSANSQVLHPPKLSSDVNWC